MTAKDLLRLKSDLELSPDAFLGMTGLSCHKLRRGRLPDPITLPPDRLTVILRARRLHELALEMSGDHEKALDWIYSPSSVFSDRCPIDLCADEGDFLQVERYIDQLRGIARNPNATIQSSSDPVEELMTEEPRSAAIADGEKFRIAERLKEARAKIPDLSKAEIARAMVKSGHPNFTGAKLWRYEIGYEPTWGEIKDLSKILRVDPYWLLGAAALEK